MFARTIILGALCAEAAFAAPQPNLAARWGQLHTEGNSTNGTSGSHGNGTVTNSTTGVNDTQILQFALNLEHLESNFYSLGLSSFNDSAFEAAGFDPTVRQRFVQIAEHEATHVELLQTILGDEAPQPCNYTFPFTDPASFAALSFALESAGESAYLGAAADLKNKTALTIAGTILAVEARQAAFVGGSVLNNTPWNGPFDTPLNASAVFSLASQFIVSCPSTNPPLPVVPLPVLSLNPANATINETVTVALTGQQGFSPSNIPIVNTTSVAPVTNGSAPLFLAYYHGFNVSFSELNAGDNTTTIPDTLAGVVYTALVSSNETLPTPDTTLSGLAVLNIPVPPTANSSFN